MTSLLSRAGALAALTGLLALPQAALASPAPRAVVELFTSQGCSSCPPADRVLADLAREPDVIALTLPVDYWDYLGWKDTLAQTTFSARQRGYAATRGDRQVYTPQVVVNGRTPCIGSDRAKIERSVRQATEGRAFLPVTLTLSEADGRVVIETGAAEGTEAKGPPGPAEVWLLPVSRAREVTIARGENRGKTVTYANVVRGFTWVGAWKGGPSRFEVPLTVARGAGAEAADGYVVLLQAGEPGRPGAILAAAKSPEL